MSESIRLSDHFSYSKLLRFTLPSICMMVFTSIYGVVDGLFVANFAGKEALAAVNLVFPLAMALGSVGFMFDHKCVFKFKAASEVDPEELELEMIDLGVDEFYPEEDGITVYAPYESFGAIQKWLDDKGFEIVSGESVRIPTDVKELDAEGRESVEKLVEKLEEDDDVVNVYHTMKEADEE